MQQDSTHTHTQTERHTHTQSVEEMAATAYKLTSWQIFLKAFAANVCDTNVDDCTHTHTHRDIHTHTHTHS